MTDGGSCESGNVELSEVLFQMTEVHHSIHLEEERGSEGYSTFMCI